MKEKQNEDFEVKELMGKFTMDTIASCAFGVDAQSFNSAKRRIGTNSQLATCGSEWKTAWPRVLIFGWGQFGI